MADPEGLLGLWGYADGAHVEVVTRRGVLIPLALAKGWSVVDLAALLGDIDGLPEVVDSAASAPAGGEDVSATEGTEA